MPPTAEFIDADELAALLHEFDLLDADDSVGIRSRGEAEPAALSERDDGLPARAVANPAEIGRLHQHLYAALPPKTKLRFSQARHVVATQSGADADSVGATGSGMHLTVARLVSASCCIRHSPLTGYDVTGTKIRG